MLDRLNIVLLLGFKPIVKILTSIMWVLTNKDYHKGYDEYLKYKIEKYVQRERLR